MISSVKSKRVASKKVRPKAPKANSLDDGTFSVKGQALDANKNADHGKPDVNVSVRLVRKTVSKTEYSVMKDNISTECQTVLVPLFGKTTAYMASAQAMAVVDRYEQERLKLPGCHRSLISFAMAVSPIPDEDVKRRRYTQCQGVISLADMRSGECKWAMTLPFNTRPSEP